MLYSFKLGNMLFAIIISEASSSINPPPLIITPFSLKNGTVKLLKDILTIYNSYFMVIYFQLTPTEIPKL
jgi:hypothetical protein